MLDKKEKPPKIQVYVYIAMFDKRAVAGVWQCIIPSAKVKHNLHNFAGYVYNVCNCIFKYSQFTEMGFCRIGMEEKKVQTRNFEEIKTTPLTKWV